MASSREELDAVDRAVVGARLLGAELEPRFRVLGVTLETIDGAVVQLLCHPVGEVRGRLLREDDNGTVVERFDVALLPDVVAALGEPTLTNPLFPATLPPLVGDVSFAGSSGALDGRTHGVHVAVEDGRGRRFELVGRFDEIEVRDDEGRPYEPTAP